jgi:hypothetical protein
MHVTGRAQQLNEDASDLRVNLEAWSGGSYLGKLQVPVQPDGGFTFDLRINPDGVFPVRSSEQIDAGSIICDTCHTKYEADLDVPEGEIHLVVTVEAADGEQARDDRWVMVDVSRTGVLKARLVDGVTGEPVQGVTVQASTRLYEWRARTTAAVTGQDGTAILNPEILSQASTIYSIRVPGQVVDGVFYEGQGSTEGTFPTDSSALRSVVIKVRSRRGEISGNIDDQAAQVWAVQLPAGPAYNTGAAKGVFTFKDMPVARYLVFSDVENPQSVDLSASPKVNISLTASRSYEAGLKGSAFDGEDAWLPFAWLALPGGDVRPIDLSSSTWTANLAGADKATMVLSAPGYYSQVIGLQQASGEVNVSLNRRPDMRSLAWGSGEILLPPETTAVLDEDILQLESGWVWGGSGGGENLSIDTPQAEIQLMSGRFALSRLPGQTTWFYLLEGAARVHSAKSNETINVGAGTMVGLEENGKISVMPYEAAVYAGLNRVDEAPVSTVWEPTLSARLQKRLVELGLTAAKVVTYVTYLLVFISITAIPFAAISLRARRRNRPEKEGPK